MGMTIERWIAQVIRCRRLLGDGEAWLLDYAPIMASRSLIMPASADRPLPRTLFRLAMAIPNGRDPIRWFEAENPAEEVDLRLRCRLDRLRPTETVTFAFEHDQGNRQVFLRAASASISACVGGTTLSSVPCSSRMGAES